MSGSKSLHLALVKTGIATAFLERHHPLGKGAAPSFAFGVFWQDRLEGVLTFGSPIVNNAVQRFGLRSRECLELRKMFLTDAPPRNSESRALAVAARLIGRQYPAIQILITYCEGDEAASAYKAAGWIDAGGHKYLREIILSDGRRLTVRNANRQGGIKRFQGTPVTVHRKKLILPMNNKCCEMIKSILS